MKAAELGEFGLIAHLAEVIARAEGAPSPVPGTGPARGTSAQLLLGIGDDAAVWRLGDALELATTDTLVAGVHFLVEGADWRDLGWKALAVNLSDIAAMGGIPHFALITLGLPPDCELEPLTELYEGLATAARTYGTRLVGGDIVGSPVLFVTVALHGIASGTAYPEGVLRRAAARPDDLIAVTGWLGSSAAGLQTLSSNLRLPAGALALFRKAHARPQPRVAEGQLLWREGVRCAMDISDGLLADLSKLCAASGVAARIEQDRVSVDPALRRHFPDTWRSLALSGGEDYELLFTASPDAVARVQQRAAVPVTVIGSIEQGEPGTVILVDAAGEPVPWHHGGWDHLAGRTP